MAESRLDWEKGKKPSEISEDEAWRLVNESGLLTKVTQAPQATATTNDEQEDISLPEEILNTAMLVIPFSFLLLLMEILVHYQYGQDPSLEALADRMLPGVPVLSIFIFYTNRHKQHRRMQFMFFVLALLSGPRMIWLVNKASYLVNMKQCPPVATLWVYAIVQLDLGPSVLSLLGVGLWAWYSGMRLDP